MTPEEFTMRRRALGWSKAECARQMHVNYRTVARWETGDHPIPGPAVAAMELAERLREAQDADSLSSLGLQGL